MQIFSLILLTLQIALYIVAPPAFAGDDVEVPEKYRNNSCAWCHGQQEGHMQQIVSGWESGVHKKFGISCADCHGGNRTIFDFEAMDDEEEGFIGSPDREEIPDFCARCHSDSKLMGKYGIPTDQLKTYKNSRHGQRLFNDNDQNVPTCINCHGVHGIKAVGDKQSPVYYTNLPETCAVCHADAALMKQYGRKADQLAKYKKGMHGRIHYGEFPDKNPAMAPVCTSCHGKHVSMSLAAKDVPHICGNCHIVQTEKFQASPHGKALAANGAPSCISCHGNHMNEKPSFALFDSAERGGCGSCHKAGSNAVKLGKGMKVKIDAAYAKIAEAKAAIATMEQERYNVEQLEGFLIDANTHIHMNHSVTHALDLAQVNEHMTQATDAATKVLSKFEEFKTEIENRFKMYLAAMAMIVIAIGLVYTKWKIVTIEFEKEQKNKK